MNTRTRDSRIFQTRLQARPQQIFSVVSGRDFPAATMPHRTPAADAATRVIALTASVTRTEVTAPLRIDLSPSHPRLVVKGKDKWHSA